MNLFELAAKLILDSDDYEDGLNKSAKSAESFGDKAKKAFSALGKVTAVATGAAIAGVTALTKSAVDSYANYEQLAGGVDTLFGESADKMKALAQEAYKNQGMSANDYMETVTSFSASLIQSLDGDTAAAVKYADMAITSMSDNANKMGTDISSIQTAYSRL